MYLIALRDTYHSARFQLTKPMPNYHNVPIVIQPNKERLFSQGFDKNFKQGIKYPADFDFGKLGPKPIPKKERPARSKSEPYGEETPRERTMRTRSDNTKKKKTPWAR